MAGVGWGAGPQRLTGAGDRRQHLVLDRDKLGGVPGLR